MTAIYPGPNLSRRDLEHRLYPYLLRGVQITAPNEVWGIEAVYLQDYRSVPEAVAHLGQYFAFYNSQRLHQALNYRTPEAVYWQLA